jgi:integrase
MEYQNPRALYRDFKAQTRKIALEHAKRDERYLYQIEAQLGCSVLLAGTASQIDRAIVAAAEGRKRAYNGGYQDDGAGMRFRLGQAAKCYSSWAFGERLIERNVYPQNNHRRPPPRTPNFLDESKISKLLKLDLSLMERLIIRLFLDTGLRISELVRLKVRDVDLREDHLTVYMTKVERWKEPVFFEATKRLLELWLKTRRSESEYLFPGRSDSSKLHISDKAIRRRFQQIGEAIGFRMNPHSLRHALGAVWMGNGATLMDVLEQLGHRDMKMGPVYVHLGTKHRKKAIAKVYGKVKALQEVA